MTKYVDRPVTILTLPADENALVLHPEQLLLKCATQYVDLGALCFLKRSTERRKAGQGRKVVPASFSQTRAEAIHSLTNKFVQESASRRLSVYSIEARGTALITYMDWCDGNGHVLALEGLEEGRIALKGYISHLRHLMDIQRISNESAHTWQTSLLLTLQLHFNISNISLGINLIVRERRSTSQTAVPTHDRLAKFLSFHEAVFSGLCELALDGKPFPHAIEMPDFVGYTNNKMWIFPGGSWTLHPDAPPTVRNQTYDYVNGRIMRADEVSHLYSKAAAAAQYVRSALAKIAQENEDLRTPIRIRFACIANLAFVRIFEAVTGANRADVARIVWTDELAAQLAKPTAERQGFRSVKARANNREVHYQVGVLYLPLLRRFVQLRAWLLNGESYESMFFHYVAPEEASPPGPTPLSKSNLYNLESSLHLIYPKFKEIRIGPRKTRAAKQDDTIRKYDPVTSAKVMQHSVETAIRHYSNGSSEVAREEMGGFLQEIHVAVTAGRHVQGVEEERAIGGCKSKNQPRPISDNPAVQPDCIRNEGCLFCDKHCVHPDEKDVRKLHSAKFVIAQTSALASSAEEYDRIFGATMKRIDDLLQQIRVADVSTGDMIDRVANEVSRGMMDNYWSAKLEELIEAGIL